MGRAILMLGLVLVVAGLVIIGLERTGLGRTGLGIGRLPGDIVWRGRHGTVFAPLGTSLLLSILLSLILYIVSRLRR